MHETSCADRLVTLTATEWRRLGQDFEETQTVKEKLGRLNHGVVRVVEVKYCGDEDAQRLRAWTRCHDYDEERRRTQKHWRGSVRQRSRLEQKVKVMVFRENTRQGAMLLGGRRMFL